ncbi:MAG: GNAT family N-acetyltransferase [Gammaproteobacteria bacterium]
MKPQAPFSLTTRLDDGSEIQIGDITPEVAPLLVEGMKHLSPLTRRLRFHGPKKKLSDSELAQLVSCDGFNHIGLGVGSGDPIQPVAAARCVRAAEDPSLADAAIVVVDEWQGRGVGKLLMRILAERALAVGITSFRGTFMADNLGIRRLIDNLGAQASNHQEGSGFIDAVFPLKKP